MISLLFQSARQGEEAQVNQASHTVNWLHDQKSHIESYSCCQFLIVVYLMHIRTVMNLLDTIICSQ